MNTTKPQIKKPEIWDIAISKKVARDFVINNPTFDNSNNLIEKMREEMVALKSKGEGASPKFIDYLRKVGMALGLSTHKPVAETVREEYRTFLIEMIRDIERDYDCKTAIEKALAETIASSYVRTLEFSRDLSLYTQDKNLSHEKNGYCSMLSKEIDRAYRIFLNALMTLKQIKSPTLELNIKAKTAFIGQNQQFNNKQN